MNNPPPVVPPHTSHIVVTNETHTNIKQGAALGGWLCFVIATIIMFIPIPLWFIYAPLYLMSFILGIVAIAQKRIAIGIMLLLANLIAAPILFLIALAFGIATWTTVLMSETNTMAYAQTVQKSAQTAAQVERIDGAFGKKLGDVFDTSSAVGGPKLADATPTYLFSPTNGFRSFKQYFVVVTPTTHKIYSIWGVGNVETVESGKKEQTVIMELLKQKYGAEANIGMLDAMGDVKRISQGSRYVLTKLTGFADVTIEIRYYDSDLEKLAEKERLAAETQKADKSGL